MCTHQNAREAAGARVLSTCLPRKDRRTRAMSARMRVASLDLSRCSGVKM
jgi:hypothetical protein